MFNRKRLISGARSLLLPSVCVSEPVSNVVRRVAGRTLQVPGQKPLRYPRDAAAYELSRILSVRAEIQPAFQADAAVELLLRPQEVFSLADLRKEAKLPERHFATIVALTSPIDAARQLIAVATFIAAIDPAIKSEFKAVKSVVAEVDWFLSDEDQELALEDLFRRIEPERRIIKSVRGMPHQALWIGGSIDDVEELPRDWQQAIHASAAVRGLAIEVLQRPMAYLPQVLARVRSTPPEVLVLWEPYLGGTRDKLCEFYHELYGDGIVLVNPEACFEDALIRLRWDLDEVIFDWESPVVDATPAVSGPAPGELRFYRKHHGSKVGDKMLHLTQECGHNNWRSTNSGPRALKGIQWLEQACPQQLFRCAKCGDWKARF
jgi:hypothetical protein